MLAVFVYWSIRFRAAAFSSELFGAEKMLVASSSVASPILTSPR